MSGRPEDASTAAGLMSQHLAELKTFLNEAALTTAKEAFMSIEIKVPAMGESVTEATIATGSRRRAMRWRATSRWSNSRPTR